MLGIQELENISQITKFVFVPTNDDEYENLRRILDEITDIVRGDETHPLASLMDVLGVLIESYETEHTPDLDDGSPLDALKYFIETFGLKQSELPEIGSQGVVSEILNGKRQLNVRQIEALAQRFNVSPALFV